MAHPSLTSRSAVFDFFRAWGYRVRATEWDTADLLETVRRTVGSMHIVADHSDGNGAFQIFLIELPLAPDGRRSRRARRADLRRQAFIWIKNAKRTRWRGVPVPQLKYNQTLAAGYDLGGEDPNALYIPALWRFQGASFRHSACKASAHSCRPRIMSCFFVACMA